VATGDKKIVPCFTCGKKVEQRESLYAITDYEIKTGKKHVCQGRKQCPGPAFCEDVPCDYCSHL